MRRARLQLNTSDCRHISAAASRSFGRGRSTTSVQDKRNHSLSLGLLEGLPKPSEIKLAKSASGISMRREDFTDVRDVVRAYRLLAELGQSGEVYNVCSGRSITIAKSCSMAGSWLSCKAADVGSDRRGAFSTGAMCPMLLGDCRALHDLTKWEPQIPPKETIADVLEDAGEGGCAT